ncbi:hypothetical protein BDZ45DRAFT_721914 [Acephala macrosclerotiorum]|nr:hypothetical protein BDZ45DRAFT_721914 [Acephala macrosclerotiorum]
MPDAATEAAKQPAVGVGKEGYTFRFVEVGEPSQDRDEEARSVIRSHVMRDFYEKRDRRRQPSTLPSPTSAAPNDTGPPQTHRFKVGPQGLHELKRRRKKSDNVAQQPRRSSSVATHDVAVKDAGARSSVSTHIPPDSNSQPFNSQSFPQTFHAAARNCERSAAAPHTALWPRFGQVIFRPGSQLFGSGVVDPFNTLPPSPSPATQRLLYFADRGILSSRLMGQLRTEWLFLATQDTALFHVALSHYAGDYGLAHQENDPVEALRFRMEAMKLVNERLENIGDALTDGTLGTVAALSSYEVGISIQSRSSTLTTSKATNGSVAAIEAHMKGLDRLLTLRGGITADMDRYIRRLLLWADLNCANALGNNPNIAILDTDECARAISWFNTAAEAKEQWPSVMISGQTMPDELDLGNMTKELRHDFTALKYFSELGPVTRVDNEEGKRRQIYDSDKLFLVERSLLTLSNAWGPGKFAASGCIAATIFLDNYIRGIAFRARIMAGSPNERSPSYTLRNNKEMARLQFSMNMVLNDITRYNSNEGSTKAMIWVLFVGGVAAGARPEREWFISHLLSFTDALELQLWEQAEPILKSFLWPAAWQNLGRALWTHIEEAKTTKSMI